MHPLCEIAHEKEGCEQHEYSLWPHQFTVCSVEGHTQVNLSGLSELAREDGDCTLIAQMCDIQDTGNRQLDRWRWDYVTHIIYFYFAVLNEAFCHALIA